MIEICVKIGALVAQIKNKVVRNLQIESSSKTRALSVELERKGRSKPRLSFMIEFVFY